MGNRLCCISGMGYSGKSAIIDFLYENNSIIGLFNDYPNESAIINTHLSLFNFLKSYTFVDSIDASEIIFVLTGGRLPMGFNLTKNLKIFFKLNYLSERTTSLNRNSKNFLYLDFEEGILHSIINDVIKTSYKGNDVVKIGINIIRRLIEHQQIKTDKVIMLHNDPHHRSYLNRDEIKYIKLLNADMHFIVIRNPYDVFFEQNRFYNSINSPLPSYKILLSILKQYLIISLILSFNIKKIEIIVFEEILNRDSLTKFFIKNNFHNSNKDISFNGGKFSLENSKKNIGISVNQIYTSNLSFLNILNSLIYKPIKKKTLKKYIY